MNQASRQQHDKRAKNNERNEKRQDPETEDTKDAGAFPAFSKDEIDGEERRPKHKVAVMIGYSGTGYKGMQMSVLPTTLVHETSALIIR